MQHPYASFIGQVEKPARYLGGEYQSITKDPASVHVRIALAFPDLYDIGMSHLGTKILYSLLNKQPDIACERAFTPWVDMEAELRRRGLPLVTLESAQPLSAFDVVGISLQYEMTFTNALTMLDLGGVTRYAVDRGEHEPLVIGGGPTATHPDAVSDFFCAFLIGEAEEVLPTALRLWKTWSLEGLPRRERLIRLSMLPGFYVPQLYTTTIDDRTGFEVVVGTVDPRVPRRVSRVWVRDLNQFPFPSDTPVPYAEAVFDRVAVEIARGCTEGCRFCQAGMIYRPVREREPESIVDSVIAGVDKGGYDETSLTALSTADVSCITPLVKRVMSKLRQRQVSLSVSSLRAYGLSEELLDEMSSVRATGLTFAPEAGTQRMRDVINKNITEADITASAEKIFSRGWSRMKCYFMIGLPTETDEDVVGIAQTGGRLKRLGKKLRNDADVTVSVSSHVPKPHTPFQWAAMDTTEEIIRKQRMLRELARAEKIDLKWHEVGISHVEGILSRGDRRLGRVIESAWLAGARFDGWDEHFSLETWDAALTQHGIDRSIYLGTIPVDGRVPWDHLDIGLEDGFLADEYRKALKDRLSPPCGKPNQTLLHHANLEDAQADQRKLVCYDCGIACDMSAMRQERIEYLVTLDAKKGAAAALPSQRRESTEGMTPAERHLMKQPAGFAQEAGRRFRLQYEKLGRTAFISHLDTMRLLIRVFRRAGIELVYSKGFHPKPILTFGPALGLGVASACELVDLKAVFAGSAQELGERLMRAAPEGLAFVAARELDAKEGNVSSQIQSALYAAWIPTAVDSLRDATTSPDCFKVERVQKKERKSIDVGAYLQHAEIVEGADAEALRRHCDWERGGTLLRFRLRVQDQGGAKPIEAVRALLGGAPPEGVRLARLALDHEEEGVITPIFDEVDRLPRLSRMRSLPQVAAQPSV